MTAEREMPEEGEWSSSSRMIAGKCIDWDGMGWDMPVNALVQLQKSYQAWHLGENLYRYTYEEFLLNMTEENTIVSYNYKSNL